MRAWDEGDPLAEPLWSPLWGSEVYPDGSLGSPEQVDPHRTALADVFDSPPQIRHHHGSATTHPEHIGMYGDRGYCRRLGLP